MTRELTAEQITRIRDEPHVSDLTDSTLEELTQAAINEHDATLANLAGALFHCIRLGVILHEIRARPEFQSRGWEAWYMEVGLSEWVVFRSMRIAAYQEHLPPDLVQRGSIKEAIAYLRGLPPVGPANKGAYSELTKAEARRLKSAGLQNKQIAEVLGTPPSTVSAWVDPAAYKRGRQKEYARRKKLRKAIADAKRSEAANRAARSTGGELAEAYALVRRALAVLDRGRVALDAIPDLHRAEDAIIRALRANREHAS